MDYVALTTEGVKDIQRQLSTGGSIFTDTDVSIMHTLTIQSILEQRETKYNSIRPSNPWLKTVKRLNSHPTDKKEREDET